MNAPRFFLAIATVLAFAPVASAQAMGRMVYTNRVGRAISLNVIDAGHPTLMSLQAETGDAEKFRVFLLAHAGQEGVAAKEGRLLPEKAPMGWRVKVNRHEALLRTPEITFWRYTSGWVVPVRFKLLGQDWQLLSADLPPRMFVPSPGKGRESAASHSSP